MRYLLIVVAKISITIVAVGTVPDQSMAEPAFTVSTDIITQPKSGMVLLADFNADGRLDLLVQHLLDRKLALHANLGGRRFAPPTVLEHELEPGAIALGDWNGDQISDLAIASKNHYSGEEFVYVLLTQNEGRFIAASTPRYEVGHSITGYKPLLKIVDVNGDGRDDIITANARRDSIEVLLGQGGGRFTTAGTVALYDAQYHTFDLADMNADGNLDLVVASQGNEADEDGLAIHLADGRGSFVDALPIDGNLLPAPRLLAASDINNDRRPDVILGHADTSQLSVLLSQRDGTFAPALGSPFTVDVQAFSVAVEDTNRDGVADIFVATAKSVFVFLSDGIRLRPAPGSPFAVRPGAYTIVAGDLTGDGKTDILASSFDGESATMITAH